MTKKTSPLYLLTLGALGVVYGDIGTSPLYAISATFGDFQITPSDILGLLSLIVWALIGIISIKYLGFIFRADNCGEGGMFALLALIKNHKSRHERTFYFIAIFGAGLLLGDAMLTPAISVVSAMEGLKMLSPQFEDWVLPSTFAILLLLFFFQSQGTHRIGRIFGPIIAIWFITIGILGITNLIQNPSILCALNPWYGIHFLYENGMRGYLLLGGIFLVVTGGEALYADIGHFGKKPIRVGWFILVFPALILNYFGQGALLLEHPEAIKNPFFMMAPSALQIPLIVLAALATIIASQAVISATFSLTKQAVLLGICPKIPIIHTSATQYGQIYVPQINIILAIGTLFLLFVFKSSNNLAHAYGIAVNCYMLLITLMVAYTAKTIWNWSWIKTVSIFGIFISIDTLFLGANAHKFLTGGWLPVLFASFIACIMYTWTIGMQHLKRHFYVKEEEIKRILNQLDYHVFNHLKNVTSIFITDTYDPSGGSFLRFLRLSMAVPEHVLIVNYKILNVPRVHYTKRYHLTRLSDKVYQLSLEYGFMEYISIPDALNVGNKHHKLPFPVNTDTATYIVEIPNIVASKKVKSGLFNYQDKLFAFLSRNYSANLNIEFYNLPYHRTIAIGRYCPL